MTSLFPAGTEIAFAVGAGDEVVGVSHACDYPPEARDRKVVTRARFDPAELSSRQIHNEKVQVRQIFGSVFRLDESALWGLRSNVVIAQGPGEFPLVALDNVRATAEGLNPRPSLVLLYPQHLDDVLDDHARVGFESGHFQEASALVDDFRRRIEAVESRTDTAERRTVAFVQWLDPPIAGGYWIPQMIEFAGGLDVLNVQGVSPSAFDWRDLQQHNPDVLVIACEDMDIERVRLEKAQFTDRPSWPVLRASRDGRVFIGDGAYFTRPGPRVIDGLEALGWALHPDLFPAPAPEVLQKFED